MLLIGLLSYVGTLNGERLKRVASTRSPRSARLRSISIAMFLMILL